MSQTWFASQTGPIALCACSREARSRSPRSPSSCQNPAPKSAPASTAYAAKPIRIRTTGTSARVKDGSRRRRLLVGGWCLLERPGRKPAEQPGDCDAEADVDEREGGVADRDALGARHCLRGAHDAIDDPRLAADLGGDPAGEQGDERERAGGDHGPVEPG